MLKYIVNVENSPWSLEVTHKPYIETVNNGYYIRARSETLIEQLRKNEYDRNSEVMDWFLFRSGKSILIDNYNNAYLCMLKGQFFVELALLLLSVGEKQQYFGDVLN